MGGACSKYGTRRGVCRGFVGKPKRKRPFRRLRRRWDFNIKMGLQQMGFGVVGWIDLAHDRDRWWALVGAVMNLRVT